MVLELGLVVVDDEQVLFGGLLLFVDLLVELMELGFEGLGVG
jgi:hypothetical protein